MRTINVDLFEFDELSDAAKVKALDNNRYWNVEHVEWWDCQYDYWKEKLECIGFENSKIEFSGFASQGDGASFTADLNIDKLATYMAYDVEVSYEACRNLRAVAIAWENGRLRGEVIDSGGNYSHEHTKVINWNWDLKHTTNLDDEFFENLEPLRVELCRKIYADLESEYEAHISDEAVADGLKANDREFTEDGENYV